MARHSKTVITFGSGLRARLHQLRKRSGLTLRAMTVLMDRQTPGAHAQLSRLERGNRRLLRSAALPLGFCILT